MGRISPRPRVSDASVPDYPIDRPQGRSQVHFCQREDDATSRGKDALFRTSDGHRCMPNASVARICDAAHQVALTSVGANNQNTAAGQRTAFFHHENIVYRTTVEAVSTKLLAFTRRGK